MLVILWYIKTFAIKMRIADRRLVWHGRQASVYNARPAVSLRTHQLVSLRNWIYNSITTDKCIVWTANKFAFNHSLSSSSLKGWQKPCFASQNDYYVLHCRRQIRYGDPFLSNFLCQFQMTYKHQINASHIFVLFERSTFNRSVL